MTAKVFRHKCKSDHCSFSERSISWDGKTPKPEVCYDCEGHPKMAVSEITDPEEILEAASSELENANRHSLCGKPEQLFEAIKNFIPKQHHYAVAIQMLEKFNAD